MAHSVVKVIETDIAESLTLIVGEDGVITPDKETALSILGNRPTTDLNILYMNKTTGNKLDVTLDSLMYINSDEVEDADFNMDEVSRNLRNLQLDHDYTAFKSPARPPVEEEVDLEDELAQTLRLLDGNLPDDEVEQKMSQINKQKEKDAFSKKIESPSVSFKATIKGAKMITTNQKLTRMVQKATEVVEKAAPQTTKVTTEEAEEMEEDEDDDESSDEEEPSDDEDDSDFTLDDEKPSKPAKRAPIKRSLSTSDKQPPKPPLRLSKIRPTTPKTPKIPGGKQPPKQIPPPITQVAEKQTPSKAAVVIEKQQQQQQQEVSPAVEPEVAPVIEQKPQLESISRIVEKKPQPPKKEKKVPKPIPDDFALFSTPDIIRRVGAGKDNAATPAADTPTNINKPPISQATPATSATSPKPAKISPGSRSRTTSIDTKTPSKLQSQKRHSSDSKQSRDTSAIASAAARRPSVSKADEGVANVCVQEFDPSNSGSEEIAAALEEVPSAEDIRAIIQSNSTKTFTTYDAGTTEGARGAEPIPSATALPNTTSQQQAPSTATLDPVTVSPLDHIDQTLLLDNISPDLITDDILYQVAQSLVDNTVLQNAIDKMEVDPAVVSGFIGGNQAGTVENTGMNMTSIAQQSPAPQQLIAPAQQIVRPDGRVITLPPVERPTTRSRNRRGPMSGPPLTPDVSSSPVTPTPSANASAMNSPAASVIGTPTSGLRLIKTPLKPLDDDHVSGNELDSSENDEDDGDEEDPNKLWCICNQPHNNRFMICCDTCEEWYHGKCVNVTKAMGQAMEAEGKEWMCLYCKDLSLKRPKAAARRIRKASRTSSESASKSSTSTVSTPVGNRSMSSQQQHQGGKTGKQPPNTPKQLQGIESKVTGGCLICGKPTSNNKLFCSDECIVKHAANVEKKVVVYDRRTHKLLSGANAPTAANLDRWLKEHPTYEVVRTKKAALPQGQQPLQMSQQLLQQKKAQRQGPMTQSKLKLVRNDGTPTGGVSLALQKKGVNIGVLKHGPAGQQGEQGGVPKLMKKRFPPGMKLTASPNQVRQAPTILNSTSTPLYVPTTPKTVKLIPATSLPQYIPTPQGKQQSTITKAKATIQTKLSLSVSADGTPPSEGKKKSSGGISVNTFIRDKAPGSGGKKERQLPMPTKTPVARQAESGGAAQKQENIREGIRKSLLEQLQNRLKLVEDLKLTDDELSGISEEIESQLYKCFGDTGQKYRNKYRSLIFNIKDLKNQTLWRKICENAINPYQLVRLSSDDLASQELALWRERETKHQLDMIKKSELELMNCTRQYVFKTHKGEQVFEDEKPKENLAEVISDLGADSTLDREGDRSTKDRDKKSSSKSSKRDRDRSKDRSRDRDRKSGKDKTDSKERRRDSKERSRKRRSRSRDRSDRDKKRSRSRDRYRDKERRSSHKSSRHKKDLDGNKLDKKSTELLEQLVDKHILKPFEDKLWKHVPQDDLLPNASLESDSDHEPTSTVTIPTPPRSVDPEEAASADKSSLNTITAASASNDSDDKFDIPATPSPTTSPKAPPILPPSFSKPSPIPIISLPLSSSSSNASSSPGTSAVQEPLWRGSINMVDVAEISITAHEVSGDCKGLTEELPPALDIVGRISPDTVWDYIGNMKCSNSKVISLLRLNATNVEEKMPYIALYSYLSSRNRLGVVKVMNKVVKDFYILPLASHRPIPQALLPLNGPGFEESRPHLLLGIVIRHKRKRLAIDPLPATTPTIKRVKVDVIITGSPKDKSLSHTSIDKEASKDIATTGSSRSYTPPPSSTRERDPRKSRIALPLVNLLVGKDTEEEEADSIEESDVKNDEVIEKEEEEKVEARVEDVEEEKIIEGEAEGEETVDDDEPYSPEDSDPDSIIVPPDSSHLNANDISSLLTGSVKASSFIESGLSSSQTFEPFTSKFDSIPGLDDGTPIPASALELQRKMAELDQKIAMSKAEIDNMSQDIASTATTDIGTSVLANIALPSDLQQILENIKTIGGTTQKETATKTPDRNISSHNPRWSPPDAISSTVTRPSLSKDLTMPLILPRLSSRNTIGSPQGALSTPSIPLNLPTKPTKSQMPPLQPAPSYETASSISVLSSLTEDDLIRKAAEMLGETKASTVTAPPKAKKMKMDLSGLVLYVPPPPLPVPAPMGYVSNLPPPLTSGYQTIPVLPPLPPKISTPPVPKKTPVEMAQPPIPGLEDEIL